MTDRSSNQIADDIWAVMVATPSCIELPCADDTPCPCRTELVTALREYGNARVKAAMAIAEDYPTHEGDPYRSGVQIAARIAGLIEAAP